MFKLCFALVGLAFLTACQEIGDTEAVSQTDTIEFKVPSAGWELSVAGVYQTQERLICVYQLTPPSGMAAQVISTVTSNATFTAADLPHEQFVLGKTWAWNSNPEIHFIDSLEELEEALKNARSIEFTSKED